MHKHLNNIRDYFCGPAMIKSYFHVIESDVQVMQMVCIAYAIFMLSLTIV